MLYHIVPPKNKKENQADNNTEETKAVKKEKDEQDTVPVDHDAKNYFDAQDTDPELSSEDEKDYPM